MVSILILTAAVGAVTILLVQRLWAVFRPHHVTPRKSLGLLIVAGSVSPIPPSPNSEKPGGSAVLALLRVHHLELHVVFLSAGSPNKARFGAM
uniref:Asparagine-linked glycosylation 14 n=1 Tax=Peromyscus maniculatus bairdii TaxID=230844 RepID=A0A8C8W356_PERMB